METQDIEKRLDEFREQCRRRGLRVTPQRTEVLRVLTSTDEHPDAETILKRVRRRIPNISLDSVYRILYWLEEEGMISNVLASKDRLRFDGNSEDHHHFVCAQCGMIRDFVSDDVDRFQVPEEVESWGRIERRELQIHGVCRNCLGKGAKTRSG